MVKPTVDWHTYSSDIHCHRPNLCDNTRFPFNFIQFLACRFFFIHFCVSSLFKFPIFKIFISQTFCICFDLLSGLSVCVCVFVRLPCHLFKVSSNTVKCFEQRKREGETLPFVVDGEYSHKHTTHTAKWNRIVWYSPSE